ncbi:MAG: LD-carboxypeptidase [Duodenibacillus sp.]|nr:LD-carboxypeptidase [Duodenibacillus sp.]
MKPHLAIAAPSRALVTGEGMDEVDAARFSAARAGLEALGWRVSAAGNVLRCHQRFAGTDDERAAGLMQAFCGMDADFVLALRGGYGCTRLLPLLDWDALAASEAPFMGLSDCTALNCALLAIAGKPSWQGPVASWFSRPDPERDAMFQAALSSPHWRLACPASGPDLELEGVLWGGNLSMLASLAGTPWLPAVEGGILVVEDVAEPAWRIERMLDQLANAGVLARQRAIVAGDMRGHDRGQGEGAGRFALGDAFAYIARKAGLPVIAGLPFGHVEHCACLPLGVPATLKLTGGRLELATDAAPAPLARRKP